MDTLWCAVAGRLETKTMRRYLVVVPAIYWGLIFVAWLSYPAEHHYSIKTHTFSFLGSYDPQHNPEHWWIFSTAMIFWGIAAMPIVLYIRRRLAAVSGWASWVTAAFLLIGCINIVLVGIFPDARNMLYGNVRVTDVHEKVAVFVAVGFVFGLIGSALMLISDLIVPALRGRPRRVANLRLLWPYLFWLSVTGTGVHNQITWGILYAQKKAAAKAAGTSIGSSWSESMGTIYAFPLWENLVIYALFIFLIWFAFALTKGVPGESENDLVP